MSATAYAVRTATRAELDLMVDWAAAEGWNPGQHDADSFHAADPDGFLVGTLDGRPIGCIAVVRYGVDHGFLGFYIMRPEYRGRGLGLALWQAGMARLAGRTVGLDGVVAQQDNYRKSGFVLAWNNVRYEGIAGAAPEHAGSTAAGSVIDLARLPFTQVEAYDRPFFPAPRAVFLRAWLRQPGSLARGLLRAGQLAGYGVIRPCRNGWKIGPLFADDSAAATTLCQHLTARIAPGTPVFLDVPAANPAAVALAVAQGMTPGFETARMYAGPAPQLPLARTFGITTFELG